MSGKNAAQVNDQGDQGQQDDNDNTDVFTSGNENIDRYIEESIRAQDGDTDEKPTTGAEGGDEGQANKSKEPSGKQPVGDDKAGGDKDAASQQQQKPDGQAGNTGVKDDGKGNLVDAQGKIVAHAGAERRFYDQVQHLSKANDFARKHIKDLESELATMRGQQATQQYLNGIPQQFGLNQREVAVGLQLVNTWKKNPHEAVKYLLTEYAAMGHNVAELLGKDAAGIDMGAIRNMIEQAVGPINQDRASQQQRADAEARAEREYNSFMAKYPEAKTHETEIAQIMQADANISAEAALFRLKSWALEQGLDFTKPLGPQYSAKLQGAGHSQPPASQGRQSQTNVPPMPNGRGTSDGQMQQHRNPAKASDDWDDIIREELNRSGINA